MLYICRAEFQPSGISLQVQLHASAREFSVVFSVPRYYKALDMSASTKQVPLWPGEEEALRPQAPQTLKLDPWKLSVLEDMIELNSSPSALEILAAAVETGLYVDSHN